MTSKPEQTIHDAIDALARKHKLTKQAKAEVLALFADAYRSFAYHIWQVEKTHGATWVERIKKQVERELQDKK